LGHDLLRRLQTNTIGIYPVASAAGASVRRQSRGDASFVDETSPAGMAATVQGGLGAEDVSSLTGGDGLAGSQREAGVHRLAQFLDVVAVSDGVHGEVHADVDQANIGLRNVLGPATLPLRSTGKVAYLEVHTGRPLGVVGVYRDQLGIVDNVVLDVEGPRRQHPSLLSQEVKRLRVIDLDHALLLLTLLRLQFLRLQVQRQG